MKTIAIFASGSGSNAENLIHFFNRHQGVARVAFVVSDNPNAGVLARCQRLGVSCRVLSRSEINDGKELQQALAEQEVDLIVLAGYLGLIGGGLLETYSHRIVNLHPALLPKFGGKGMYGERVHGAVLAAGERFSGITIHLIDADYDKGEIVCQAHCPVDIKKDTPNRLAERIHRLEHLYLPLAVVDLLSR